MANTVKLPDGGVIEAEKFRSMPYEEKYALIKGAFDKIRDDPTIKGVIFDPVNKKKIDLEDIVDTPHEVEIIDAVIKSIEQETIASTVVKGGDVKAVLERIRNGTATEEEKQFEQVFEEDEDLEGTLVIQNIANMIVQVAQFTESQRGYTSQVHEYFIPLLSIFSLQALFTKNTLMNKYYNNPDTASQIAEMLGKEIMDNWKKTATSVPDNLTLAMALLTQIIELTQGIPVGPTEEIAKLMYQATGGSVNVEIVNGPPPANGSNGGPANTVQAQVYTGEDAEMRDILRD